LATNIKDDKKCIEEIGAENCVIASDTGSLVVIIHMVIGITKRHSMIASRKA